MRLNSLSFVGLLGLLAGACAAPSTGETDEVVSSDSNLSAGGIGEACSAPVRSSDGAYAAIDLCPRGDALGQVVRVDLTSNAVSVVATYAANDRVENLSEQGNGHFVFDVLKEVDASGGATRGIDVHVHDWALAGGRTISTAAVAGVAGDFHRLAVLELTDDRSNVFYAASAAGAQAGDAELARRLMVAAVSGADAPAAVDLGEGAAANDMRFGSSGDSIVGHTVAIDPDTGDVGEDISVIEFRGAAGPRLTAKKRAKFGSGAFPANPKGKPQKAWDGTRAWGVRAGANESNSLVTFDPRTDTETVLETGTALRIVNAIDGEIFYATRADVAAGVEVTLKKIPAAGGAAKVLATATLPTVAHAKDAFDTVAIGTSGKYGVFTTMSAAGAASQWAPKDRWVVKLDGSTPATQLSGQAFASTYYGDQVLGDRFLYSEQHSNGQYGKRFVDLATGEVTSGGISLSYAQSVLVGDGAIIELESCVGPQGGGFGDRFVQIRRTAANGVVETGPCGRSNWSNLSLAIAGSPNVVFYSELSSPEGKRYSVVFVKP